MSTPIYVDPLIESPCKILSLYNHKGGVGKTSTAVGLAWKLAQNGHKVLIIDADPQANCTGFLVDPGNQMDEESRAEEDQEDFPSSTPDATESFDKKGIHLFAAFSPLFAGEAEVKQFDLALGSTLGTKVYRVKDRVEFVLDHGNPLRESFPQPPDNLYLLGGHLKFGAFESAMMIGLTAPNQPRTAEYPGCIRALCRQIQRETVATTGRGFDFMIFDLSPSIGLMNQAVIMSSDYLLVPCSLDYYSFLAIQNLQTLLSEWDAAWYGVSGYFSKAQKNSDFQPPPGKPIFLGHTLQIFTKSTRRTKEDNNPEEATKGVPARAFRPWIQRIGKEVERLVDRLYTQGLTLPIELFDEPTKRDRGGYSFPYRERGMLQNYQSMGPLSANLHVPVFALTPYISRGLIGGFNKQVFESVTIFFEKLAELVEDPFKMNEFAMKRLYDLQQAHKILSNHNLVPPNATPEEIIERAQMFRETYHMMN